MPSPPDGDGTAAAELTPYDLVARSARVKIYAGGSGTQLAEGVVVGYLDGPSFVVHAADGIEKPWMASLPREVVELDCPPPFSARPARIGRYDSPDADPETVRKARLSELITLLDDRRMLITGDTAPLYQGGHVVREDGIDAVLFADWRQLGYEAALRHMTEHFLAAALAQYGREAQPPEVTPAAHRLAARQLAAEAATAHRDDVHALAELARLHLELAVAGDLLGGGEGVALVDEREGDGEAVWVLGFTRGRGVRVPYGDGSAVHVSLDDLPPYMVRAAADADSPLAGPQDGTAAEQALTRVRVHANLSRAGLLADAWRAGVRNVSTLARAAGLNRSTVYTDLQSQGIDPPADRHATPSDAPGMVHDE